MSSNNGLLGAFDINDGERLHLAFKPFGSRLYVDVRIYVRLPDGGGWVPTKKGVRFDISKLPDLDALIKRARAYALGETARDLDGRPPRRRGRKRK